MADNFGKLVAGIAPSSGSGTTEWFTVPDNHQYQGYIRAAHNGSSGSGTTEYTIYGLSSSGASPTVADIERVGSIDYGDTDDLTFDLAPGEAIAIQSTDGLVSFNFRGLDIDGS